MSLHAGQTVSSESIDVIRNCWDILQAEFCCIIIHYLCVLL